ncbi:MAG: hypothetical protein KatS3mg052_0556 [Candidatus Roseilinea sp.]|nr:MAG: hypothetical protein KatS3mg052_0556 [Candidatus Roseilinea sp.]
MRDTLRRFARLTAGYSLVTLIGPAFTILLTPLYTRVLSPDDYGVVEVATTLSSFMTILASFAIDQALNAYFFDGDETYQRNLVTTAQISVGLTGLVLAVLLVIVAEPLAEWLYKDPARRSILYLIAFNVVSAPLYNIASVVLRLKMGVKRVNVLGLTFLSATIVSNVALVLLLRFKATGVVAANALANGLACLAGLVLTGQILRGRFTPALVKPLFRTGAGLLLGSISLLLFSGADRVLLTQYVSQEQQGLYAIANKLATMVYVLLSAPWTAWWPLALEMGAKPDAPAQYARMLEYFAAGAMMVALSAGLFAPEILAVFARDVYVPAAPYALALMIYVGPLAFIGTNFQIGLYVKKQTRFVSGIIVAAAAINIALNVILDPLWGVWGAVWSTVAAGAFVAVASHYIARRFMPVPYRLGRVGLLGLVYLALVIAFLAFPVLNAAGWKLAALCILIAAIPATGIISRQHIQLGLEMAINRAAILLRPDR